MLTGQLAQAFGEVFRESMERGVVIENSAVEEHAFKQFERDGYSRVAFARRRIDAWQASGWAAWRSLHDVLGQRIIQNTPG